MKRTATTKSLFSNPALPCKPESCFRKIFAFRKLFFQGEITFNDQVYITNARHKEALTDALASLKMVEQSIIDDMPEDFFSIDLMSAYESLGRIIGESVGEDLVNEIFSKFCMGK